MRKLDVKWHGLLGLETEPMGRQLSEVFMGATLKEMSGSGLPKEAFEEIRAKMFTFQVFEQRLTMVGAEVGDMAKMFLAMLLDTPGKAVMWAYTLNYIYVVEGRPVTMAILAEWFPMGFPTEDAMHKAWDSQKKAILDPSKGSRFPESDNWIDDPGNWPRRGI